MAIHVKKSRISPHPLAHVIGQPAHGENVPGAIKSKAIIKSKTLAGENFVGNWT